MLRPIQVAPLSQTRLISQNPLVPNNMTQAQYMQNQFATPGAAPITPNMAARPMISPVQAPAPTASDLNAIGQAGLQGAERISKSVTRSPGVQGLLGGGQSAAGLLGDIGGQADLQGLFATLSAMGRPVARGESRLLGAVEYGQQARQQAQQQGLQDLTTRMKLDEYQRSVEKQERDRQAQRELQQYLMTGQMPGQAAPAQPAMPTGTTGVLTPEAQAQAQQRIESTERPPINDVLAQRYDAYEIGQLSDAEKADAALAIRLESAANMASAQNLSEQAENYRKQAEAINERIGAKFLSREKRADLSYGRRDQWDRTEYRPRVEQVAKARQLVELAKNPSAITDISLIFGLMKSLDPRSTVRDSEAAMVENAQGAFTRLLNIQNRIQEGRLLPDEAYPMIVEQALVIADAVEKDYQAAVDKRLGTIEEEGLKPDIVVPYRKLGAPDIQATMQNLNQILNLSPGAQGGGASAIRGIRDGRSGAAQ